ncbi:MAG: PleD family two-component system response regulator [Oscillatoria sp. PMC 1051.18]|nr:PleD family two-component system response regulator [Oscillatoria sp. PMC 1050.18]MEC5031324.1 PleD family two-component system response regulator [Oscillatoria sp. PMC 1051.18]
MIESSFASTPPLILVVDDEKTLRIILCRAMEKEGYRVVSVADGEEALAFCQQQQPDMILLDAMMPSMDGFTCCAKLQTLLGDDCPPVLMITALDDRGSVDLAFEVGATDYVTKPIHWAVLRQRVRRLLAERWAMIQLRQSLEKQRSLTKQLETVNQELQRLVNVDGLTGVANRRCFSDRLQIEWRRGVRSCSSLSLIMCDVDFFKAYNDTYGHQAGDFCLQQVAKVIEQNIRRPADLAARYGGEEFAVILPDTKLEGGMEVAKNIRTSIAALNIPHHGSQVSDIVTLSLGLATVIPSTKISHDTLISEADKALYQAKQSGRNRVIAKLIA